MTGENWSNHLKVSSLREGFFSRQSDLTTIASSMRFRIACLQQACFVPRSNDDRFTSVCQMVGTKDLPHRLQILRASG